MRYPEGHKEEQRARIVDAAASALRRHGIDGVSIPALMKKVGLTHGGFYGHFANRDELVAAAVSEAAARTGKGVFEDTATLEDALRLYLSPDHVAHPEDGCVLAALGTDAGRQPARVRRAFAAAARGLVDLVQAKLRPGGPRASPSDEALLRTAQMIGAVVLARLVDDEALAKRVLAAARR